MRQAYLAAERRRTDWGWQLDNEAIARLLGGAVRQAFETASSRLNAPDQGTCNGLAVCFIDYRRNMDDLERAVSLGAFDKAYRVGKVIGTLVAELPELVEAMWEGGNRDADELAALLKAARRAAGVCPERKSDRRSGWQSTADIISFLALSRWRDANPGRKIGKPLSADQPATRLITQLLRLAGYDDVTTPERVAKHFERDPSFLPPIDVPKSRQKDFGLVRSIRPLASRKKRPVNHGAPANVAHDDNDDAR